MKYYENAILHKILSNWRYTYLNIQDTLWTVIVV